MNEFIEWFALDEFHCVIVAIVRFAEIINGNDVRMVKSCGGLGFATKSRDRRCVSHNRGQNLEGHDAIQPDLNGAINDPHSTLSKLSGNLVAIDAWDMPRGPCGW